MERAKRIQCPAPLPKEPAIPRLAKMLVPAPYKAPEKKAKKKAKGAKSGPRRKGTSDVTSEDETCSSAAEDDEEEEKATLPLRGEGRRGRPPQIWRRRRPRGGRAPLRITPHGMSTAAQSGTPETSPWPHRKY